MQSLLRFVLFFSALFYVASDLGAQTFSGELRGRVEDASGAVLPQAKITILNESTGFERSIVTGTTGEFSFPDLPLGTYQVSAASDGFQEQKSKVEIVVSRVSSVNFRLAVASQAVIAEVNASVSAIETTSTTLTGIVDSKAITDLPMNGRDFRQMLKLSPGVNPLGYSVNGNRTRSNNYQIDGADNNDGFQNTSAVNQGGVSGIAGTLLPIEAIDQFSVATSGSAEMGRNGGGSVNLVIKSGTNDLHGSAYYFNRNEFLAANTPLAAPNTKVRRIRNQQDGFSLGGPIIKNRTFFFVTGELQKGDSANAASVTTLSPAWLDQGSKILSSYGVAANPVTANLVSFYPARIRTGPAVVNNYFSTDANTYDSYNGIVKVDHNFNANQRLSVRYYGGTGTQAAVVDSNAPFKEYFQVAPSHMHNVSTVLNSVVTPNMVNSLVLGANYFLQTFNDFDTSPNPIAAGLNTGVTTPSLLGSPTLRISGFATAGATQPLGRTDTTGHITDTLSWNHGAHQMKIGGEYRHALLDIYYNQGARGTFNFDGTRGPWASDKSLTAQQRALADFLAGYPSNAGGATIARLAPGVQTEGSFLQRDYTQNSFDLFVHDTWRISPSFSLNFGARYTYLSPLADKDNSITTFVPGQGIVGPGHGLDSLYHRDWNNIAPRIGFAWQPTKDGKTVIRGGYGVFFDVPAVVYFSSNTGGGNGGAVGVNANPGGPLPVQTVSAPAGLVLQSGVDPWAGASVPILGVLSVNQDFATAYIQNLNFNVQRELWSGAVFQTGYVGSLGRKLTYTRDINAALPGTGSIQSRRPYNAQYPTLGAINQLESGAVSNYHSLQTQLTQRFAKGITATVSYTWGKAIDTATEPRNNLPANSYYASLDRGPSDFDVRHIFNAFVSYSLPTFTSRWKLLTQGWQINTLITAHSGQPINFRAGTDANGDGDTFDRIDLVGDPFANLPAAPGPTSRVWVNRATFAAAAPGTTGNLGRNAIYGPGFFSVDPSIFKDFPIKERLRAQFRAEIFNALNWTNFANPTVTFNSGSFGVISNTRNGSSAPGLGFGEPRNVQLAVKLIW